MVEASSKSGAQGGARTSLLISVIVPAYNEQETIASVIKNVLSAPIEPHRLEVIVVDDGSTDQTWEVLQPLREERVKLLRHERNRGKGAAIQTALEHVRGDVVIIQDADLEYNPRDYPKLLDPILRGVADAVYGSRFIGGEPRSVMSFWHSFGNRVLTLLSNLFTNLDLTDMETGYKAFRTEVLRRAHLTENRFGFEPEVTAELARLGVRLYEVGISYWGRPYEEGKKLRWRDGLRALYVIIKCAIRRRLLRPARGEPSA